MASTGRCRAEQLEAVRASAEMSLRDYAPTTQVVTADYWTCRCKPLTNTFLNLREESPRVHKRRSRSAACLMPDCGELSSQATGVDAVTTVASTKTHSNALGSLETSVESRPNRTATLAQGEFPTAPAEFTTVMLQNLPSTFSQKSLLDALNGCGLRWMYDFVYVPCAFSDGRCLGYAFINFRNPDDASWLVSEWDDSSMLCDSDHKKPMRAFQAGVQGLEALRSQPSMKKLQRVRNPAYRPFIARK
mmetsp:Transcript_26944/g.62178  ORF Transcript_26944/g.62178 Transcript_26944/m.62178 type:complete len:247 (-) Transcript_26944:49-789(-)